MTKAEVLRRPFAFQLFIVGFCRQGLVTVFSVHGYHSVNLLLVYLLFSALLFFFFQERVICFLISFFLVLVPYTLQSLRYAMELPVAHAGSL